MIWQNQEQGYRTEGEENRSSRFYKKLVMYIEKFNSPLLRHTIVTVP